MTSEWVAKVDVKRDLRLMYSSVPKCTIDVRYLQITLLSSLRRLTPVYPSRLGLPL